MLFEPRGIIGLWERLGAALASRDGPVPGGGLRWRLSPSSTVRGVGKRFGGLVALDGVSFDVEQGSIFSVIGPNGAGKTTLFSCLVGSQRPTTGSIRFQGEEIAGLRNDQVVARGAGPHPSDCPPLPRDDGGGKRLGGRSLRHAPAARRRGPGPGGRRCWSAPGWPPGPRCWPAR